MAGTIRITPQELRDAAGYLNERLEAITNEATSLKAKLDEIGANWEGAAHNTFFDIFENEMWPILSKNVPDLIVGIENQLNGSAEALEQADLEVADRLRG